MTTRPGIFAVTAYKCSWCRKYRSWWHRLLAWLGARVSHGCCAQCAQENFGID